MPHQPPVTSPATEPPALHLPSTLFPQSRESCAPTTPPCEDRGSPPGRRPVSPTRMASLGYICLSHPTQFISRTRQNLLCPEAPPGPPAQPAIPWSRETRAPTPQGPRFCHGPPPPFAPHEPGGVIYIFSHLNFAQDRETRTYSVTLESSSPPRPATRSDDNGPTDEETPEHQHLPVAASDCASTHGGPDDL